MLALALAEVVRGREGWKAKGRWEAKGRKANGRRLMFGFVKERKKIVCVWEGSDQKRGGK